MEDDAISNETGEFWAGRPTPKQRTAVQHEVTRLLDDLAPERAPARVEPPTEAVQKFRSPRGAILQAPTRAVTVSWFPSTSDDANFGELQIITWRGVVSRPGSASRTAGATAVSQTVLRPVEVSPGELAWKDTEGALHDGRDLAARCRAYVEETGTPEAPRPTTTRATPTRPTRTTSTR